MDETALRRLLADVAAGRVRPDDAVATVRRLPFADLGFAKVDHHRALRQGMAEAVYGPGKTVDQCVAIVGELLTENGSGTPSGAPVLLTRASPEQIDAVTAIHPGANRTGTTMVWRPAPRRLEQVVLVSAGTADLPVASQCEAVLVAYGIHARGITDVGVAGLHRLLASTAELQAADAVVVVAGMEGALASVVGGLTGAPVVAVPTSVGYGAALEGVTALLAMLASCASGVTVVGIDNGFGAAGAVLRLLWSAGRLHRPAAEVAAG